ncbi:hypothetical protein [uncultured Cohaesibacter sp.]|uniref:hypothetical protein n=1 Tax=uncultured Cohaesibacter sp. TaxID=1002546 RepID=UPI00292CC8A0|nr:hypothetical protein [uncultured Cohaesibacter sp.]
MIGDFDRQVRELLQGRGIESIKQRKATPADHRQEQQDKQPNSHAEGWPRHGFDD